MAPLMSAIAASSCSDDARDSNANAQDNNGKCCHAHCSQWPGLTRMVARCVGRAMFDPGDFVFFAHREHAVLKAIRDEPPVYGVS